MPLIRKSGLAVLIAVAASMLTTASAAGDPIEVTDEATSTHCPAVSLSGHAVSGGCVVNVASNNVNLIVDTGPRDVALAGPCSLSFNLRIDESGEGYATNQAFGLQHCGYQPCDETNHTNEPWPVTLSEHAPGRENLQIVLCARPESAAEGTNRIDCTMNLEAAWVSAHVYEFATTGGSCAENPALRWTGTWQTQSNSIEVDHPRGVEVTREDVFSEHCTEETCELHVESDGPIVFEFFYEPESICEQEADFVIDESGSGEFVNQMSTGPECWGVPCDSSHWPVEIWEDRANSMEAEMQICVMSPWLGPVNCHLVMDVEHENHGQIEFVANVVPCPVVPGFPDAYHVTGRWVTEAEDNIEIAHAPE